MARKLRIEREGGLYHVLNRGNYRQWVFETEGAKKSFEKTLFEACERSGWVLHAYVIMGNHYHLALETPQPNLSEGMRWLQSVFAIRFNHLRKERGHIFQGRFSAILIENTERIGRLAHYIHLNPVRAGICTVAELADFGHASYATLMGGTSRPSFLNLESCLTAAGNLCDTAAGRKSYQAYLAWLAEDEPAKKAMNFDSMSKGWAQGSEDFKKPLVEGAEGFCRLNAQGAKEQREVAWEERVDQCLKFLSVKIDGVESKSADWKVGIAAHLKLRMLCRNGWLAEKLAMGTESAVSRHVTQTMQGLRPKAAEIYRLLDSRFKD